MSRPSGMIDEVVRDHVGPVLKAAEFRKTARNWHSDLGHVVRVVNLQGSSWNSDDVARFTINLGLWFPEAAEIGGSPAPTTRRPPEYLCTVRQRIGHLMPENRDVWWDLTSSRDAARIGPEVASVIEKHVLPWLDRCSVPLAAFEFLREQDFRGNSLMMAFALALSVDPDLARDAYAEWSTQRGVILKGPMADWARTHSLV